MKIGRFSPSTRAAFAAAGVFACIALVSVLPLHAQRLPTTILPEHYVLTLTPNLQTATFTGDESIDLAIKEPVTAITVNAIEIAFQSVTVTVAGKEQTATIALDQEKQQATFTVPDTLPAGNATIHIQYTGILNDKLRGFYLSKSDHRNYAVTQFEPTDARRAFPSFDEPAFKATYAITLVVNSGDTAISNSPIASDTPGPGPGKHTLKFLTTPKMSSYLVAFLVGDFKCTSGESDGVTIRSCATPDKLSLTPYALSVAEYMLHYYDTYFGVPYPLKKLDLIAIPDFEAGAMENFGAITFRETDLLLDPKIASLAAQQRVSIVVAHEMAHQWFGDLVTMEWWNNIWLNEGFATWMENKSVAVMHPDWDIPQTVALNEDATLNLDAQETTRAIRAKADTPAEINQMFDGIAYGKAGDVLLSVENYLGPETFRKGVQAYLQAHLYANATAQDFWYAETAASRKPVDKIMDSLVAQPGVPLLIFGKPAGGSSHQVPVQQERFFLNPTVEPNPAQKWTLPVCFKTGDPGDPPSSQESKSETEGQHCEVLTPSEARLKVPPGPIFFANAGGKGYYRTEYPPSVYADLEAHVETDLEPTERISLIGDVWAQVRANKISIGKYLNLVSAVNADPDAIVISSALSGVVATYQRIAATPEEKAALSAWLRKTLAPEYEKLGPPSASDSPNTRELRANLFAYLGYYGNDPAIQAQAKEIAEKYLADRSSVDPTLGQMALNIAARNGDFALFDQLQKIYETSTNPEFQVQALRLLADFEKPALVERALNFAVSGKVRNQDAAIQVATALRTDESRDQAWKFIQSHWDQVQAQLTTEMGGVLVRSAGSFCSESGRESVQAFFSTHKVAASGVALQHAVQGINSCMELRNLQEPQLKTWLASQPKS